MKREWECFSSLERGKADSGRGIVAVEQQPRDYAVK